MLLGSKSGSAFDLRISFFHEFADIGIILQLQQRILPQYTLVLKHSLKIVLLIFLLPDLSQPGVLSLIDKKVNQRQVDLFGFLFMLFMKQITKCFFFALAQVVHLFSHVIANP